MSESEHEQVLADAETAFGTYSTQRWRWVDLVRQAQEAQRPDAVDADAKAEQQVAKAA